MERMRFRSTSILDIQAELRQRELLAEASARQRGTEPARTSLRGLRWFLLRGRSH